MMMELLMYVLLLLGIVWAALGIAYLWSLFRHKVPQRAEIAQERLTVTNEQKEQARHLLVAKSKPFHSPSIPEVPAISSTEKTTENPNTFAEQRPQTEQQTVKNEAVSEHEGSDMEEGENEIQVAYTMDEPDEDAVLREDLQIADEAMPEALPTAILSRDLNRVCRWVRKDDSLDNEDEVEVHETLLSIRGTDLMEYMEKALHEQEGNHQKLLMAICSAEENELVEKETLAPIENSAHKTDREKEQRPLSYYL